MSFRKEQKYENADKILTALFNIDPLNHFARFESYLLNPNKASLKKFTSLIRNELPHETYLELGIFYATNNLIGEAIEVLRHAPSNPIINYWLAYLQQDNTSESQKRLDMAVSISPYLVFPHRTESIPVLQWARKQHSSWKNDYYIALIDWYIGRHREAMQLLDRLNDEPDYVPFCLTRGKLHQLTGDPDDSAGRDFEKARTLDPDNWRTIHTLSNFYLQTGATKKALSVAHKAYSKFPDTDEIEMTYASAQLANHNYEDCIFIIT